MIATLETSYRGVVRHIEELALQHGRNPDDISLLAVSKGHSVDAIRLLYERCGHRDFGENYAQELIAKQRELIDLKDLRWHFIGQLQTNKIAKLVPICHHIASIASDRHLQTIKRITKELGLKLYRVSILINAENEAQKAGATAEECIRLAESIASSGEDSLELSSIMAVPPAIYQDTDYDHPPQIYRDLKDLANRLSNGKLSLGMSSDLSLAIAAGSTTVRIGTAIFGERPGTQT